MLFLKGKLRGITEEQKSGNTGPYVRYTLHVEGAEYNMFKVSFAKDQNDLGIPMKVQNLLEKTCLIPIKPRVYKDVIYYNYSGTALPDVVNEPKTKAA